MTEEPDNEAPMGDLRRRSQDLLSGAVDLGKTATDRIRETDAGGKAIGSIERVGQQTADTARKASGAVNQEVAKRTDNLALGSYRSELDAALEELVAVVIAQDAEIRALRDRLDSLTADGGGGSPA